MSKVQVWKLPPLPEPIQKKQKGSVADIPVQISLPEDLFSKSPVSKEGSSDPTGGKKQSETASDQREDGALYLKGTLLDLKKPLFEEAGKIITDSTGKIGHIALPFEAGNGLTALQLKDDIRNFLTNLEPDTKFSFVVEQSDQKALESFLNEVNPVNRDRIRIIPVDKYISIWFRDSMLPAYSEEGKPKIMIQDRTYWPSPNDPLVPKAIAEANPDIPAVPMPLLRVDGGNILSNSRTTFIGVDSADQTTDLLQKLAKQGNAFKEKVIAFYENRTNQKVVETEIPGQGEVSIEDMWRTLAPEVFKSEFKREVHIIGTDDPLTPEYEQQPVFHMDMAFTPIGDDTVLVADPSMAISIVGALSPERYKEANRELSETSGASGDILKKLIRNSSDPALQRNCDSVARDMEKQGYKVFRLPYLASGYDHLPFITYNNCILEDFSREDGSKVKRVFLPTYGVRELDSASEAVYESLGFDVKPVTMAGITTLKGAIRCSCNIIDKTVTA
ncbi:MAG: hypothetical protein HYU64_11120 [Armatimonadetes bacterium]|nr:hypothetical protein [Armatimonadota bacterium]